MATTGAGGFHGRVRSHRSSGRRPPEGAAGSATDVAFAPVAGAARQVDRAARPTDRCGPAVARPHGRAGGLPAGVAQLSGRTGSDPADFAFSQVNRGRLGDPPGVAFAGGEPCDRSERLPWQAGARPWTFSPWSAKRPRSIGTREAVPPPVARERRRLHRGPRDHSTRTRDMAKKIAGYIKLQIPAGKANPSPPVGPVVDVSTSVRSSIELACEPGTH